MAELKPLSAPEQFAFGRSYAQDVIINTATGGTYQILADGGVSGTVTAAESLSMTPGATNLELTSVLAGWYAVTLVGTNEQINGEEDAIFKLYKTPSGGSAAAVTGALCTVQGLAENVASTQGVTMQAMLFLAAGDKISVYFTTTTTNDDITFSGSLMAVRVR